VEIEMERAFDGSPEGSAYVQKSASPARKRSRHDAVVEV